jgi:hypothetical protein
MTTSQKVLGGGLLLLVGFGVAFLFQAQFAPKPLTGCNCLEVAVRLKNAPDCDVDYEAVNLHVAAATTAADQIRWCTKGGGNPQYFIHFLSNSGNDSPFSSNDFLVNKNTDGAKRCSDIFSPAAGKPTGTSHPYLYEIRYPTAAGTACTDPMVILK